MTARLSRAYPRTHCVGTQEGAPFLADISKRGIGAVCFVQISNGNDDSFLVDIVAEASDFHFAKLP
jgi:hypothetical protein